ncbi:hypothetical protein GCM10009105_35020 [Dokdonella soli]|uniref:Uncharacterized protein n=1 Tax=Dokdonella soli TaxID=529810 RepID=A0ABN1IXN0_9GAMM
MGDRERNQRASVGRHDDHAAATETMQGRQCNDQARRARALDLYRVRLQELCGSMREIAA